MSPARLDEAEVATLVQAAQPDSGIAELARRVYLESEGLPLFVAEYLAALRGGRRPGRDDCSTRGAELLDDAARADSATWRARCSAPQRRSAAPSTSTRCAQASGRSDEEAVGALEELVAQGWCARLRRRGAGLRLLPPEAARAGLRADGLARRRLLHRRVAAALSRRRGRARRRRSSRSTCAWPATTPEAAEQLSPRRRARRVAARSRRRARAPRGGAGARPPRPRRAARADRRPADARRRLRRRAGELREAAAAQPSRRRWRRSSRSSAASTTGAASGSAPRRACTGRARSRRPATAGPAGAHPSPTSPSRCTTRAGATKRRDELAREALDAGRGRRRPTRTGAGPQHARRARPEPRASCEPRRGRARAQPRAGRGARTSPGRGAALNNLALVGRDAGRARPGARADRARR